MKKYIKKLFAIAILTSMSFEMQFASSLALRNGRSLAQNRIALQTAASMGARAAGAQTANYSSGVGQPQDLRRYADNDVARRFSDVGSIGYRNFSSQPEDGQYESFDDLRIQQIVDAQLAKDEQDLDYEESMLEQEQADRVGQPVYRSVADIYNPKNYGSSFMNRRLGMGGKKVGDRQRRMFSTASSSSLSDYISAIDLIYQDLNRTLETLHLVVGNDQKRIIATIKKKLAILDVYKMRFDEIEASVDDSQVVKQEQIKELEEEMNQVIGKADEYSWWNIYMGYFNTK